MDSMMGENNESESKTLLVGNLPEDIKLNQLEAPFNNIGPVRRCHLVREKRLGYVTFALREDAELAIKNIKTIGGKKIHLKFAKKKVEQIKSKTDPKIMQDEYDVQNEEKTKPKYKKKEKNKDNPKNWRLIIRNISFKATEKSIKEAFEKFGTVIEVVIPKKDDGKMKGFCFVQFSKPSSANHTLMTMNGKEFLSRPIAVDWAIPKSKYLEVTNEEKGFSEHDDSEKEENVEDDESEDDDDDDDKETDVVKPKKKSKIFSNEEDRVVDYVESDDDVKSDEEEDDGSKRSKEDDSEDEDDDMEDEDDDMEDEDDDMEDEDDDMEGKDEDGSDNLKVKPEKKPERTDDVIEGKTLFVRNLSFAVTKESLAETFSKFGELEYAVISINKQTEYSSGSGFVKFRNKEDAAKCLEAAKQKSEDDLEGGIMTGGIVLNGQSLLVNLALSREDMKKRAEEKMKKAKDSRNLYLAREGLIRPGTRAAENVSKHDLDLRIEVEVIKQQMLKNYHIFVARDRLCVRNIPPNVDDTRLRKIFLNAGGPGAELKEARVMKNFNTLDEMGKPLSKGYGFVTFTTHEHALKALRNTNNNPNIFTKNARPIVEFSLENKVAINARAKRLDRSRQNNKANYILDGENFQRVVTKTEEKDETGATEGQEAPVYEGFKSLTDKKKLPSHVGPKIRHEDRNKTKRGKGKITRRNLKRTDQKRNKNKKWEKPLGFQKHLKEIERDLEKTENGLEETESVLETRKVKSLTKKKSRTSDRNEANFDTMVTKHKRNQESIRNTSIKKKWFHNN